MDLEPAGPGLRRLDPDEQIIQDRIQEALDRREREEREQREFDRQLKADKAAKLSPPKVHGTSLGAVVERWTQGQTNEKTIDRMKAAVSWFEDDMGRIPVEAITTDDVLRWTDKLQAGGIPRLRRGGEDGRTSAHLPGTTTR